jgi:hypothetical protein
MGCLKPNTARTLDFNSSVIILLLVERGSNTVLGGGCGRAMVRSRPAICDRGLA